MSGGDDRVDDVEDGDGVDGGDVVEVDCINNLGLGVKPPPSTPPLTLSNVLMLLLLLPVILFTRFCLWLGEEFFNPSIINAVSNL